MSEYQPTLEAFLKDVETHQVEILLDQGVYRHLRCRRVEQPTWLHWFDIHTGPNFLLIRGDMGSVSFSRVEDMFEFFASDPALLLGREDRGARLLRERAGASLRPRLVQAKAYRFFGRLLDRRRRQGGSHRRDR